MPEDQRPRGRFGLPRLTDIGPQVSHHNTPASTCDKQFCFEGHTKEEVFKSIRDAYVTNKDEILNKLRDNGIPAEDIVVSGSVVRGNFGCRGKDKIRDEIDEVIRFTYEMGKFPDEAINIIQSSVENQPVSKIFSHAKRRFEESDTVDEGLDEFEQDNLKLMLDDLVVAICSDVDLFILVPQDAESSARRRWSDVDVQREFDPIFGRMNESIKGRMIFITSMTTVEGEKKLDEPTISSREGFNTILRKFYYEV